MTKVTCEPQSFRITIEGHSGSAPKGEDLVCAAASMLGLTLAEFVESRCRDRIIEIRDGFICVQGDKSVAQAFDMARCGFRMLAEMEPEHVVCADKYA